MTGSDSRDLDRFVTAQAAVIATVISELKAGRKRSHWMWFVFPQIAGLGRSETARFYAIADLAEAQAYLAHPLLGARLADCTEIMLGWADRRSAAEILGPVDAMKFCSSMTLFEAAGGTACFGKAIDAFCGGERDVQTLSILAA